MDDVGPCAAFNRQLVADQDENEAIAAYVHPERLPLSPAAAAILQRAAANAARFECPPAIERLAAMVATLGASVSAALRPSSEAMTRLNALSSAAAASIRSRT